MTAVHRGCSPGGRPILPVTTARGV